MVVAVIFILVIVVGGGADHHQETRDRHRPPKLYQDPNTNKYHEQARPDRGEFNPHGMDVGDRIVKEVEAAKTTKERGAKLRRLNKLKLRADLARVILRDLDDDVDDEMFHYIKQRSG
jgi:hypothetical protein